jgi:hypothetical protein
MIGAGMFLKCKKKWILPAHSDIYVERFGCMKKIILSIIKLLSAGVVFFLSLCSDPSGPDVQNSATATVNHGIEIPAFVQAVPELY